MNFVLSRGLFAASAMLFTASLSAAGLVVPDGVRFTKGVEYANPDGQHLQLDFALPTAAMEDSKSAVRWLRKNAAQYHIDPDRIGVMGGSAGAHLALFVGLTAGVKAFEGDQNPGFSSAVRAVVSFYGPTDFTQVYGQGKSVDAAEVLPLFLGGNLEQARQRHILASPLNWVTPAAPPTLLVHGTADDHVPYEQAVWIRDRFAACGVDAELVTLPGAGHGFKGADAKKADQALFAFFSKQLHAQPE